MYQILRRQYARGLLVRESIPFGVALFVAELFYKFHSFTLECLAFLATWFALSWLASRLLPQARRAQGAERP
jgi:hypothetical protein